MKQKKVTPTLLALGFGVAAIGCGSTGSTDENVGQPMNYQHVGSSTTYNPTATGLPYSASSTALDDRTVDYMLALRTASLKLRGNLPTLEEQQRLKNAIDTGASGDAQVLYETLVSDMIFNQPLTFNRQMFHFWRNTLRMGGQANLTAPFSDSSTTTKQVSLDTAPAYAAMLVAEDRDMRELFTGKADTCPTFNLMTGSFAKADCFVSNGASQTMPGNNVPSQYQAGILTNPGLMAQYYSNFAFRRARLIQELFACTRYPAELAKSPQQIGPYLYSSPWPVDSVTNAAQGFQANFIDKNGATDVRPRRLKDFSTNATKRVDPASSAFREYVDFKTECQNCHSTLNHRAPLFAVFDQVGYRDMNNLLMVTSTATFSPFAQIQEYLYQCNPKTTDTSQNPLCAQALAWRNDGKRFDFGGGATPMDYPGFGSEMAADPTVAMCFMKRAWNYAYSRDDVVNELALVPDHVVEDLTNYFVQNNYNMKKALLKLYTSANFIRF